MSLTYDMIHPGEGDTSTVRSVFIIDPVEQGPAHLTYPKSVGRNFDEILRVIDALQLTDLIAGVHAGRLGNRVERRDRRARLISTEDAERRSWRGRREAVLRWTLQPTA